MDKEKREFASTYERLIHEDAEFENDLKKSYKEFVLSELLLAIMAEDKVSIRSLAKQAGISPSIIQDLRSGKRDNLTLKTFSNLIDVLGYDIVLERRAKKEELQLPRRVKMKNIGGRRITRTPKTVQG